MDDGGVGGGACGEDSGAATGADDAPVRAAGEGGAGKHTQLPNFKIFSS
jgi:hypothetical protein